MIWRLSVFVAVLISHIFSVRGFGHKLWRNQIPDTADCAAMSVVVFYDVATALELCGCSYQNPFLPSMAEVSDRTFAVVMACLLAAPWLFRLGARIAARHSPPVLRLPNSELTSKPALFYIIAALTTLCLVTWSLMELRPGDSVWVVRDRVGARWGTSVVILYLPCAILAFYLRQRNALTRRGVAFCICLALSAALVSLPLGQRTLVLQPFLIAIVFWPKGRFRRRTVLTALLLVMLAAQILPLFKWQYAGRNVGSDELLLNTVLSDFSRTPVLASVAEDAPLLGSNIVPYPMAGYVYSALLFVPRSVARFKGRATAVYLTSQKENSDPTEITWGLGVGAIEESLANSGFLLLPVLLVGYGLVMGWLDRLCCNVGALVIPVRCAGLWLCGYNLPALLVNFGTSAIVCYALWLMFCKSRRSTRKHESVGWRMFDRKIMPC
jgi:hypothetical protein